MIRYADRITVAGVCLAMLALAGHALLVKHDKPPQEEQWGSHERGPVATGTVRGDRPAAPPVTSAAAPPEQQVSVLPDTAPLRVAPKASTAQRAPERRAEAPRKFAKAHATPRVTEATVVEKPADVPLVQTPAAPEPVPVPVPVVSAPPPTQAPIPAPVAMVKPEPVAETPAPAKTRAQVMEELNAARMNGALPRFGNPDPYGPGGAPSTSTE